MRDRVVFARSTKGVEIVRYLHDKVWYIEWPSGSLVPCERVTCLKAAAAAHEWELEGGRVFESAHSSGRMFRADLANARRRTEIAAGARKGATA